MICVHPFFGTFNQSMLLNEQKWKVMLFSLSDITIMHNAPWFQTISSRTEKGAPSNFLKLMLLSRAFTIFACAYSSRSIFLLRCGVVVCKNLSVQLRSILGQKIWLSICIQEILILQNRLAESFFRLNCSVYINVENRERASQGDKKQRRPISLEENHENFIAAVR